MTRLPWKHVSSNMAWVLCVNDTAGLDHLVFPIHSRAFQQPIRDEAFDHGRAFQGVKRYKVVRGKLGAPPLMW